MRALRATIVACLLTSLALTTGAATGAARVPSGAVPPAAALPAAAPATPLLVAVRGASHQRFDRVVFQFVGGLPTMRDARYVRELRGDASGLPIRIAGSAILQLTMSPANGHDPDTGVATAPSRVVFGFGNVIEVVDAGDFEAVVSRASAWRSGSPSASSR